MSTTVTDILRPLAAESATWAGFDITQIADEVVEPNAGDSVTAVADTAEQVVTMGAPAAEGYSHVSRIEIKLLAARALGDADLVVRVRIGGKWLAPITVVLTDDLAWHTASYEVSTSRGELSDLAVGLAKDGTALAIIDVLYVATDGPINLVQNADDLTLFDGTEAVRLVRSGGDEQFIAHALRSAVTGEETTASDGKYLRHDVAWHIAVSEAAVAPRIGDQVVDDAGEQWTILAVVIQTLATRYRCHARKLDISDDMTHRVDVQRAVWTKDVHGAQVAHWLAWRRGVRARVQAIAASASEQRGQQTTAATHKVFFALPIRLDHNTRIVHEETTYRVVAVSETDRIDVLMAADVVRAN